MYDLLPHPAFPARSIRAVRAGFNSSNSHWLTLRWRIENPAHLIVPSLAGKARADGLWQTTCFEMFCRLDDGPAYREFNLSPSERWAVYEFDSPREGMRARAVTYEPVCTYRAGKAFSLFDAAIPTDILPSSTAAMNLTCVLEEEGGRKSYWSIVHPETGPDFHDPACFVATLPARRVP